MKSLTLVIAAAALTAAGSLSAMAADDPTSVRVTVDNFARAETDNYCARFVKEGGFGKLSHERDVAAIDKQAVIRMNRDTLYSFGVFDLDAAPVTVTLPDPGKRYQALQIIDEDHYALDVFYGPSKHTIAKKDVGTRYVALAIRTFVDPKSATDITAAHALQDAIEVEQSAHGEFTIPAWDQDSLIAMRKALLGVVAANGELDSTEMFGRKTDVDPVQHLLGTAAGWGGNPRTAAMYAGAVPPQNDGTTAYTLTVGDVPVDGFWSVSVYNKDGFFQKNPQNSYTVNNVTAEPNNGSVTIHFGGADTSAPNYIPITPGWSYVFRMYRPRKAILDGTWKVPEAMPVAPPTAPPTAP